MCSFDQILVIGTAGKEDCMGIIMSNRCKRKLAFSHDDLNSRDENDMTYILLEAMVLCLVKFLASVQD
jgi:hypothetical protein